MTDLLPTTEARAIPLPGADIYYLPHADLGAPPDAVMQRLIAETPWRQEDIRLWGKTYKQPRLIAWVGDAGKAYRYSGLTLEPLPWTHLLADLRRRVEEAASTRFNSVLLNYYRDQQDSMGLHSDDEPELGPQPVIASLSLGATRPLLFKSRIDPAAKPMRIMLESGSLLLMRGDTQRNYKHGIAKQRRVIGPRINLTFRTILD